jgi:hypothetical protein
MQKMSIGGVSRNRGLISVALTAAFLGGCSSSPPARPDGGSTGGSGGGSGTGGKGGTSGGVGSGGSAGAGIAGTGGSSAVGTGGSAGAGAAGASGGRGGSGGSAAGAGGAAAGGSSAGGGGGSGTAGASGTGGSDGGAGTGTAGAGGGGGAVATCGGDGQACCATGTSCNNSLACLGGASCSCVKDLFDWYILRADGTLLYESDTSTAVQTAVLNATTATPLDQITRATGGNGFGCAVRGTAAEAWCWRETAAGNNVGQVGSGVVETSGPIFRATQVLVAANQPLTGVKNLVSNPQTNTNCAIVDGGKVFCWGDLTWMTSGGVTTPSAYAVAVTSDGIAPLSGVSDLSFGVEDACAILQGSSAKEVWCWGNNRGGQLAQGDLMARRYPTKVVGVSDPRSVAVTANGINGGAMACAVDADNVRCWGNNRGGYTATGSTANTLLAPTLVLKMDGVTPLASIATIVATGFYNYGGFCASTAALVPICWGEGFRRNYPDVYVAPNLVALGWIDNYTFGSTVRYLSSDGLYHIGTTTRSPNCGPLQ